MPSKFPCPMILNEAGRPLIFRPWVMTSRIPPQDAHHTKGGNKGIDPTLAINNPLMSPTRIPTAKAISIAGKTGTPAFMAMAPTAPQSATVGTHRHVKPPDTMSHSHAHGNDGFNGNTQEIRQDIHSGQEIRRCNTHEYAGDDDDHSGSVNSRKSVILASPRLFAASPLTVAVLILTLPFLQH